MLEQGDSDMELYIQEEDLFKYYQHATQSLKTLVSNPGVPLNKKTEKIYEVSKNVMQEFLNSTPRIKSLSHRERSWA